jgi:hypothetical protein
MKISGPHTRYGFKLLSGQWRSIGYLNQRWFTKQIDGNITASKKISLVWNVDYTIVPFMNRADENSQITLATICKKSKQAKKS